LYSCSFDLGQKRIDLMNVLKKAAEKGVIHEVHNLKKAFIIEEKGEQILKVSAFCKYRIVFFDVILMFLGHQHEKSGGVPIWYPVPHLKE
jgi:hypothetical protein